MARAALIGTVLALLCGCAPELPDAESPDGRVYVRECGMCHVAYPPGLMKPAMWRIQIDRMKDFRRQRGVPPMTESDKASVLRYLDAHAG